MLTGCTTNKKSQIYPTYDESNYNIVGYYQKVDSLLYQNDKIVNSNNVILNQYLQIKSDTIVFSYLENDEFKSETYNYHMATKEEIVIDSINNIQYPMSGNYHIMLTRSILDEQLILVSKGPYSVKYHVYKRINEKDYQIKYNEIKGELNDEE